MAILKQYNSKTPNTTYNSPKEYFGEMRLVSEKVKPEILKIISGIKDSAPILYPEFSYYYKKRAESNKVLLRPFIFKEFLALYGINWEEHINIAAIVEMVNISTYQSNLAFDNKDGFTNQKEKSNQFISSIFSKLKVVESIVSNSQYSVLQKQQFSSAFITGLEKLYYGQYLDINELNFRNLVLINSDNSFNDLYLKRCELLGSSLIEMIANAASIIAEDENFIKQYLLQFSYNFGLAGQIVNDLGDITGNGKPYTTNKYSDIYNEKLTFPNREIILKTNSLNHTTLINFSDNKENILYLKLRSQEYMKPYIDELDRTYQSFMDSAIDTRNIKYIGNLLIESNFIT